MLNWFRNLFLSSPLNDEEIKSNKKREPFLISELYVQPDDDDFDAEACMRLINIIAEAGAATVDDVKNITVSVEDFFDGNRSEHSIAANVTPPDFDTAKAWSELLLAIRSTDGVHDILVEINGLEPYEDGRIGSWPYSDTIWIYSSLERDAVAALISPLDPDEVLDASLNDPSYDLSPPYASSDGIKPYCVWWD
jgi:hypothetical protein